MRKSFKLRGKFFYHMPLVGLFNNESDFSQVSGFIGLCKFWTWILIIQTINLWVEDVEKTW